VRGVPNCFTGLGGLTLTCTVWLLANLEVKGGRHSELKESLAAFSAHNRLNMFFNTTDLETHYIGLHTKSNEAR
jgi:hypothetical protein